jgi:DNA-binding response OmpR family regulator
MARLLVIEDNAPLRQMLKAAFERFGHAVDGAADGHKGLDLHRDASYDLVLMDLELPDMTGPDLIQNIRRHTPTAKIIVMSGNWPAVQAADDQVAALLDADQFILKPFDLDELLDLVRRVLDRPPPFIR